MAWWGNSRISDLQTRGCGFNSRLCHYQVVMTWMGDSLWTGISQYITNSNIKVYSAFHPFGVSKSSIGLSGWG